MHSADHIDDPILKSLYETVLDHPYKVLVATGPEGLEKAENKLAVLQVMAEACRVIVEDLGEHGAAHEFLYGDNSIDYFEQRLVTLREEAASVVGKGDQ